jgi:hypothetical protein
VNLRFHIAPASICRDAGCPVSGAFARGLLRAVNRTRSPLGVTISRKQGRKLRMRRYPALRPLPRQSRSARCQARNDATAVSFWKLLARTLGALIRMVQKSIRLAAPPDRHQQRVAPESSRRHWRRRRPLSLEYIPSLGATPRSCPFPCLGCAGPRLRPWLRRLAASRTPARSECSGGHHGRDSAMRAKVDRSGLRMLARERKPL